MTRLSFPEQERYARQIILPELGEDGQQKLSKAHVLVVGAGGLGSPLLFYLAAAGVGEITIVDSDRVSLNNLHRQILYETADVDEKKVHAARETLYDMNNTIKINAIDKKLSVDNAVDMLGKADIVADGSDNITTRFLVADTCNKLSKSLIYSAIHRFEGQLTTLKPYLGDPHPSLRCLYPKEPPSDAMPSCAEAGILGPVAGIMGSYMALEVIKEITGIGESLSGWLLRFDGLTGAWRKVALPRVC